MSTDSESLSSILSGSSAFSSSAPETVTDVKPEPAPVAEPEAAPSAAKEPEAEKPEAARNEKGQFAPKAEPKPEAKAEPKQERMVPLSALLAERAKRQESPEAAKPKTSFLDNEDQAFAERANEALTPLKQQLFSISVEFARTANPDFDEVAEVFAKAAENDGRLWDQMRNANNPAMYIYQVGKQFKELAPFGGDVLKYREHTVAETNAKLAEAEKVNAALRAELEAMKKTKADLDAVPRSLNSTGSTAQPTLADADPEPITKIVRFGNT